MRSSVPSAAYCPRPLASIQCTLPSGQTVRKVSDRFALLGGRRLAFPLARPASRRDGSCAARPLGCPRTSPAPVRAALSVSADQVSTSLTTSQSQVPMPAACSARRLRSSLARSAASACLRAMNSSSAVSRAPRPRMRSCSGSSAVGLAATSSHERTRPCDPRFQLGRGERRAEKIALGHVAAEAGQHVPGGAVLDTFGHDPQLQGVGQVDDGPHDRARAGVGGHGLDERLVDLQLVDRQVLQRGQRRVARAEVVDRHAHAQRAQLLEVLDRRARDRPSGCSR